MLDHDGDNRTPGRSNGDKGDRRVYTNDDVARVPRTDTPPPQPKPDVNNDHGRVDGDRNPKVVDQQPARGTGDSGGDSNHGRDDHQGQPEPVRRSNNDGAPPTQTERQHNPQPQTNTPPPQRQPEHAHNPPPQPAVHQQAPPPVVHQQAPPAPAVHQSAPPPESHVRSSDEGSRGGRPK